MAANEKKYQSFEEFWPFYLSQHRSFICRNLHVVGTSLGVVFLIYVLWTAQYRLLILAPVIGYFFAWIGHFLFEKNRPATFIYPKWSFMGDLRMIKLFFSGKLKEELGKNHIQSF
jgi:hypothetical protein